LLDYSPVISVKLFCGAKNAIEIKDLTIKKAYYYYLKKKHTKKFKDIAADFSSLLKVENTFKLIAFIVQTLLF